METIVNQKNNISEIMIWKHWLHHKTFLAILSYVMFTYKLLIFFHNRIKLKYFMKDLVEN